ncbi:MAG: hypothetical protein IPJ88_14115 [Myxococcales bacterium]|nr:MAG: hypothetical protein IPJ88_14115 [Myxococcales bacterium]
MIDQNEANTMRVVVLGTQSSGGQRAITQSIADAIAEGTRRDPGLPKRGVAAAPESLAEGLLADADAAVALDATSLRQAIEAGVPLCVAVLPTFDTAWAGELADADHVMVSHEALVSDLVARGARSETVYVTGPVQPKLFDPCVDLKKAKARFSLPDLPVVLVPTAGLDAMDFGMALTQFAKMSDRCFFLFDVGDDAEAADALRREVPGRVQHAMMFADRGASHEYWQLADIVVSRARGCDAMQALSVGASLLLPAPGRSDTRAADILKKAGVATVVSSTRELSEALDAALANEARAAAKQAIKKLDLPSGARRLALQLRKCWAAGSESASVWPRGLPKGLETL